VELNQSATNFQLLDQHGIIHNLKDYRGQIVILNFWSCECPHSERTDRLIGEWLNTWGKDVVLLPIASNSNESIQSVEKAARRLSLPTVLIDAGHIVADQFEAVTTPHVFVVDRGGILRYQGAVDDVTFRQRQPSRFFLKEAVDALLDGSLPKVAEMTAYGCTIVREI
jgi:thiol-disulfide isomerase/thioredoxin